MRISDWSSDVFSSDLVRKGSRNAIAIALERDQAGGRHALGMLDKAIEGPSHRHQADNLSGMHIGNCAGQDAMLDFSPLCDAPLFQPGIDRKSTRLNSRH